MAKAKTSLLASIKAEPPRRKHTTSFFDSLDESKQQELLEVRKAFRAGELAAYSKADLYERCSTMLGLKVKRSGFLNWLQEKTNGKA